MHLARPSSHIGHPASLESLESRLLLSSNWVVPGSPVSLTGYVDIGAALTLPLQLELDGGVRTIDLVPTPVAPEIAAHGYDFNLTIPDLAPGTHPAAVVYQGQTLATTTLTRADQAPFGWCDFRNATFVSGWVYDPSTDDTADLPNDVKIRVDFAGAYRQPDIQGTPFSPNIEHVVNFAHGDKLLGYYFQMPATSPAPLIQGVYAIDGVTGREVRIDQNRLVNEGANIGYLDSLLQNHVGSSAVYVSGFEGWAFHPYANTQDPVSLNVYIDNILFDTLTADINRPDLIPWLGSADHGFRYDALPEFLAQYYIRDTGHTITLVTADSNPVTLATVTVPARAGAPRGYLDMFSGTFVAGWVDNPAGQTGCRVRVDVDGVTGAWVDANIDRPDLAGVASGTQRGFLVNLPTPLTTGKHNIQVFADPGDGHAYLLYGQRIDAANQPPVGSLDVANWSTISGWVFSGSVPATPCVLELWVRDGNGSRVEYRIDTIFGGMSQADINRPDLAPYTGSTGHGFLYNLSPALAATIANHYATNWQVYLRAYPLGHEDLSHDFLTLHIDPELYPYYRAF